MYDVTEKFAKLKGKDDIIVLGLESSCDETAAAVVRGKTVLSDVISSQADIHKRFGGVVPEVASRNHTLAAVGVVDEAIRSAGIGIEDVDAIAVTCEPGLIGALLVGVSTAKSLAYARKLPLIKVNHIEAHICVNYLYGIEPPFIALVASGGHTSVIDVVGENDFRLIDATKDDAIGEAFDKVARVLGLPYPGGPAVDELARRGAPDITFVKKRHKDFISYSGLKTAVINYIHNAEQRGEKINIENVCASFSREAVDIAADAVMKAAEITGRNAVAIAGGVAANSLLRKTLAERAAARGIKLYIPSPRYCTDNGVMVALRGYLSAKEGKNLAPLNLNASSVSEGK